MILSQYYQQLLLCAQALPVQRIAFTLQFDQACTLPPFTGSTLHGLLGHALQRTDSRLFNACYQQHNAQAPSPYALVPDSRQKQEWQANECYQFEIKLFGQLAAFTDGFIKAIKSAEKLGFGPTRTHYTLLQAIPVYSTPSDLAQQLAQSMSSESDKTQANLLLQSPLRIKIANRFARELPALPQLLQAIVRRFSTLLRYWQNADDKLQQSISQLMPPLHGIQCQGRGVFQEWSRYSRREQNLLQFGGLTGAYQLEGEIGCILPWLYLAEHLHIGSKASFGLGQVKVL